MCNNVGFVPQLIMSVGFSGPRLLLNHRYIRNIRNCSCRGIDSLNHKRHVLSLGVREIKGVRIVRSLTDTTIAAHTQQKKLAVQTREENDEK